MRTDEHTSSKGKRKPPKSRRSKKSPAQKMRAYRARMRARGMKLVQVWVPDIHAPGFAEEARRQSLLAAKSKGNKDALDFIESIIDSEDYWL